jgi:putative flippase GtrA
LSQLNRTERRTVTCSPPTRHRPAAVEFLDDPSRAPVGKARAVALLLRRDDPFPQFARFVLVGGTSTAVYSVLFLSLQGIWFSYFSAHLVATAASSVLANELHRRLTFHAGQRVSWMTAQIEAGSVSFVGLVATSAALGWLDAVTVSTHPALQIALVAAVTASIGLMRFVVLRWIFRPGDPGPA